MKEIGEPELIVDGFLHNGHQHKIQLLQQAHTISSTITLFFSLMGLDLFVWPMRMRRDVIVHQELLSFLYDRLQGPQGHDR